MEFITPPFVIIIGFNNKQEIDEVMEKFIAETGQYLFTVVRGSVGERTQVSHTPLDEWCKYVGAPQVWISARSEPALVALLNHWVDYVIAQVDENTPQSVKNFIMQMKGLGKHGTVFKR